MRVNLSLLPRVDFTCDRSSLVLLAHSSAVSISGIAVRIPGESPAALAEIGPCGARQVNEDAGRGCQTRKVDRRGEWPPSEHADCHCRPHPLLGRGPAFGVMGFGRAAHGCGTG